MNDKRPPDLGTQLEDLFHLIWTLEARWRFEERLQFQLRRTTG
jgi:hypothetical protein